MAYGHVCNEWFLPVKVDVSMWAVRQLHCGTVTALWNSVAGDKK